jgi:DNA adenine methylase
MGRTRPFLKWAGSKYRCLDAILASFAPAKRLIEPFTGSGAVFVNSCYPHYLLAEINQDLVSLYRYLQKEGPYFIDYCESFFVPENNSAEQYYLFRDEFNHGTDSRHRAAIFLYLNRHGYNGLCRYNQRGIYNVPFGRYKRPYFPHREMLHFYQKSQHATFIYGDFHETFRHAEAGDLIYCDPPYAPLEQSSNFSSYAGNKFGEKEQIALSVLAMDCANRGITVIISNHDTVFTRHHYRDSEIRSFPVRRFINCQAKNRITVQELVAIFR